jgi:hypothetical protein
MRLPTMGNWSGRPASQSGASPAQANQIVGRALRLPSSHSNRFGFVLPSLRAGPPRSRLKTESCNDPSLHSEGGPAPSSNAGWPIPKNCLAERFVAQLAEGPESITTSMGLLHFHLGKIEIDRDWIMPTGPRLFLFLG